METIVWINLIIILAEVLLRTSWMTLIGIEIIARKVISVCLENKQEVM